MSPGRFVYYQLGCVVKKKRKTTNINYNMKLKSVREKENKLKANIEKIKN